MRVISQACVMGLLLSSIHTAAAQAPLERTVERSVKVLPNKDTQIGIYLNVLPDCTSGPLPTIRLVNPPTAGKVLVKTAKAKASRGTWCRCSRPGCRSGGWSSMK